MSDTPETQEAVERWQQGKINIFDEMARLERERDRYKSDVEVITKERDEAREAAAMWEKVALREASMNGARRCEEVP